jgi:hypothetical protein
MRNGVVGSNTFGSVNVKGTNTSIDRNLQQVRRIGRIKTANDENEIQIKVLCVLYEFMDCILSFLESCVKKSMEGA